MQKKRRVFAEMLVLDAPHERLNLPYVSRPYYSGFLISYECNYVKVISQMFF